MRVIKNILKKYRWDIICGWSVMLTGCFVCLFGVGTLLAAGYTRIKANQPEVSAGQTAQMPRKPFALPEIPATIINPGERAEYLISHYWNNLAFADATWLANPNQIEQAFADYLSLLPHTTPEVAIISIGKVLDKSLAQQSVFSWFTGMFDKYLYDVNSPFRDEECYAIVVEHIINNPDVDEIYKLRPEAQLEQINKNRPGNVAADFTYTFANGRKGTLHGIKADYTLLFFYDPECPDCRYTREFLQQSEQIADLVNSGKLKILALYPDEDTKTWKTYWSAIPSTWLNAYDGTATKKIKSKLYAIRAIPSLYLLDRDKRVLLRDAMVEQIVLALTVGSCMEVDG